MPFVKKTGEGIKEGLQVKVIEKPNGKKIHLSFREKPPKQPRITAEQKRELWMTILQDRGVQPKQGYKFENYKYRSLRSLEKKTRDLSIRSDHTDAQKNTN